MKQILYASEATRRITDDDIDQILTAAREYNMRERITGMLVYRNGEFAQVLEGPSENVFALYDRIESDDRHTSLKIRHDVFVAERAFPDWSMAHSDRFGLTIFDELFPEHT